MHRPRLIAASALLACLGSWGLGSWGVSAAPPGPLPTQTPAPGGAWIMGYAVGYERDLLPLSELNWSALTHIVVGRATPNPDGTLNTDFDIGPLDGPAWARSVVQQAHVHGVGAILMLGGAGERAGFVGAASAPHRASFARDIVKVVRRYGFGGVDLDWEPLTRADEAPLRALALNLKQLQPGLLLTLPVNFVNASDPAAEARPSLAALASTFDRINIMSYGMAGAYSGWDSWHSSALAGEGAATPSSVRSSVRAYLAAGIPAGKLGLGSGFYGLCYRGVTGPHQRVPGMKIVADDGDMSYVNIVRRYLTPAVRRWDAAARVPFLSSATPLGSRGCTFVSYEDAQSIAEKGRYARRLGLGGTILWTLGQGHFVGRPAGTADPLLSAAAAAFRP